MLKYSQDKIGIKLQDVIIAIITVIIAVIGLKIYYDRYVGLLDFPINRTVCGYVLHGINPMNIIGKGAVIPEVGSVDYPFGNMPYGLLLGNLFYFGFLPFGQALTAFKIESIVLMIVTMVVACKYFDKHYDEALASKAKFYFNLFTIVSANILGPIRIGNNGHMLCMMLVLAIFTIDDHKIISGVCIALAMIKPQIAVPVCLSMLLYKKFIPLLVGAGVDILASIICAILVKENVISLFLDTLKINTNLEATPYFGLLSAFDIAHADKIMFYSMMLGIALVVICFVVLKKDTPFLLKMSYPIMIACFWSYSWSSDHYMVVVPATIFMVIYYVILFNTENQKGFSRFLSSTFFLLSAIFVQFHWYWKSWIRDFLLYIDPFKWHLDYFRCKTYANTFVYILMLIMMAVSIIIVNRTDYIKLGNIGDE